MILDDIVEKTKIRVEREKKACSLEEMKRQAFQMDITDDFPFEKALKSPDLSFICEVKKASPSKGLIAEEFHYIDIAKDYQQIGASCISVLTEPDFFQGNIQYLNEISQNVSIPLLRKDFIIDEYMIYQAKVNHASAILLICSLLDDTTLKYFFDIANQLGLSCLVEAHDEEEVKRAIKIGARIIGVNNRDLKTFTVDITNSIRLRHLVSQDILFVSESGIKNHEDIVRLHENHINGVLIGETLMRASNKQEVFDELRG